MGQGVAVTHFVRLLAGLVALALVSGCGNQKEEEPSPVGAAVSGLARAGASILPGKRARQAAPTPPAAQTPRAEIEKYGIPILRVVIPSRGADALVTKGDTKGDVVTWTTTDGTTFTLKNGVLIQTRGLGPDLMSAAVPTVAQLRNDGGTHPRAYFFLAEDDAAARRDYVCTMSGAGNETIEIYGRAHRTLRLREECIRPEGKITNDYWFEGTAVRKSRQWTSPGSGYIDFEMAVD